MEQMTTCRWVSAAWGATKAGGGVQSHSMGAFSAAYGSRTDSSSGFRAWCGALTHVAERGGDNAAAATTTTTTVGEAWVRMVA